MVDLNSFLMGAFMNPGQLASLQQALGVEDIQVTSSGNKITLTFTAPDKLETLLTKPKQVQVAPTRRRTKRGVQQVSGYVRESAPTSLEDMVKAQEDDEKLEKQAGLAFPEFIEGCLGAINGQRISG